MPHPVRKGRHNAAGTGEAAEIPRAEFALRGGNYVHVQESQGRLLGLIGDCA